MTVWMFLLLMSAVLVTLRAIWGLLEIVDYCLRMGKFGAGRGLAGSGERAIDPGLTATAPRPGTVYDWENDQ